MVVYLEVAIAENCLLDGLLVYLALRVAHCRVKAWRLLLSAGVGAAEAVLFPLFALPPLVAYLVKFLGGALLMTLAVPQKTPKKSALLAHAAFFLLTFALGGALTAVYSFFGVEYAEGNGYLVERAPVGLILGGAGVFAAGVVGFSRRLFRHAKCERVRATCTLFEGEKRVTWRGLFDSGNNLYFRGEPVSVVSPAAVFALFGAHPRAVGRMRIGTVNGEKEAPVFRCGRMEVEGRSFCGVLLTVGDVKDVQIILHTAFSEGNNGASQTTQGMDTADGGEREHRALPVRERGAAPSSSPRGGGGDARAARGG